MTIALSPAQQSAFDGLKHGLSLGNVLSLWAQSGCGKTTVLQELHRQIGGALLEVKDIVNALPARHPLALEECFTQLVMDALQAHDHVFIDDLDLLSNVVSCGGYYPRPNLLELPLTALTTYAIQTQKKLVIVGGHSSAIRQRCYSFGVNDFTTADYDLLCHAYLGAAADQLDYAKVFRFAAKLNAHQLRAACLWLRPEDNLNTNRFIEYLQSQYLASNVDLGEVQPVRLQDLKGVDDVIQSLEANIILPLENDALAKELGLKPKRGILLAGPPGTGKTSVGRALAHRLKSKFFLVDGTIISGTNQFYGQIHQIFEMAKQNAPAIIFVDDSDVIFESGEELGLYRYLLTMLDGLESASAGRVCVMLTAMDIGNLPPALIRSGRIELWLDMRLPDVAARTAILNQHLAGGAAFEGIDHARLAHATDGFTGADLKRLVEDGKILFGHDKALAKPLAPVTEYFLKAAQAVRHNKERYAEAEARARKQHPQRPVVFEHGGERVG